VYAATDPIHNSLTRYSSLTATLQAATNCVAAGLACEFHFVSLRRNFRELPAVARLAEKLSVRKLSVLRFVPQGRGANLRDRGDLTAEEYTELADLVRSARTSTGVETRVGAPLKNPGLATLAAIPPRTYILVPDHRARIFPCDAFKGGDFYDPVCGSVMGNSLESVWTRSRYLDEVAGSTTRARTRAVRARPPASPRGVLRAGGWGQCSAAGRQRAPPGNQQTLVQIRLRIFSSVRRDSTAAPPCQPSEMAPHCLV
jgi:MoaA/NifB/PqqE/SkfB family radical SAM enzyme